MKISKFILVLFFAVLCLFIQETYALAKHEVAGPVAGKVSSPFGMRKDPFTGKMRFHSGLDFAADQGTPIYALQDGIVTLNEWNGNYGICIILDHYYQDIPQIPRMQTLYGHISKSNVKKGQAVKRGDIIAYVGSTGRSTGPHLHFEVRYNNSYVDPIDYIYKLPGYLDYIAYVRTQNKYTSYNPPRSKYR